MIERIDSAADAKHVPNFILIGAQKSGTTALYHTLRQHPEIYMSSRKEPNFFLTDESSLSGSSDQLSSRIPTWVDYLKLFSKVSDQKAIGEASVMYLSGYYPERTAARIRERLPDVRLVAVLRNPVERAYSAYTYYVSRGLETHATFREALDAEEERTAGISERGSHSVSPGLFYRLNGLYFNHLSKFFDCFPREQIRVYLYEDWNGEPQRVLEDIYEFLEVNRSVRIKPLRRAVTGYTRSIIAQRAIEVLHRPTFLRARWCSRLKTALKRINTAKPPPLDKDIRRELIDYFHQDVTQLEGLIGRDLSHWLT